MGLSQKLKLAIYILVIIVGVGIIGYMIIEGWSFVDALFMAVLTISTVGYGEVNPLSEGGAGIKYLPDGWGRRRWSLCP